jgi:hypothetical protein
VAFFATSALVKKYSTWPLAAPEPVAPVLPVEDRWGRSAAPEADAPCRLHTYPTSSPRNMLTTAPTIWLCASGFRLPT